MEKILFNSKNIFLAKENSRIEEVAKRNKIVLPSNHTAIFQAVLSPIEKANSNGHRLAKDAVEESLPTFIGSQVNINHNGHGWMVGNILDAWISDTEEIEVVFSFAKNIYEEEYLAALEAMAEDKLTVSWELSADSKDIEKLKDGTVKLHAIQWDGMGVLIGKSPGYKKAKVYEMASLYRQRAKDSEKEVIFAHKIIEDCDKILAEENKEEFYILSDQEIADFVAEMQIKLKKNNRNKKIWKSENEQKGEKIMTEEQKKLISDLKAEFGEAVKDWKDKDFLNAVKVEEYRASLKTSIKEVKAEQKSLTEERYVTLTTYKDDGTVETKANKECIYTWVDADGKTQTETVKSDTTNVRMYSEEQLAEVKTKAETEKAEISTKLQESDSKFKILEAENTELKKNIEAQTKEIDTFKAAEQAKADKEKADKLANLKSELKDNPYTKEFKDEDYFNAEKVQIAKDRQERDVLKAENDALKSKNPEAKEKVTAEKKDLKTGHQDKEEKQTIADVFKTARNRKE